MLPGSSAADDLLVALSSLSSCVGLHSCFAAYLRPFYPHLPAVNPAQATVEEGDQAGQADVAAAAAPLRSASARSCVVCSSSSCRSFARTLAASVMRRASTCGVVDTGAGASGRRNLDLVSREVGKRNLDLVSSERRVSNQNHLITKGKKP
ncbi:hypothetical protein ZWY2020_027767 [Hordeum vulgare]|nr:hypothetical protein ZWY2020_027767 [Hordeum vulgare]